MTGSEWQRLSALTGIAFAILMVIAFAVQGVLPQADDPSGEVVRFFEESHEGVMTGVVMRVAAGIFFLWFIGAVRSTLVEAEGGTARLSSIAYGSGILMLAAGMGAMASLAALAYNAERGVLEAATNAFMPMTHIFFVGGAMGMAWFLFATALVALRTGVFPAWVAWSGAVIGLLAVALGIVAPGGTSGFSAYPLFILWVVAVSILMFRRAPTDTTTG